MSCRHSDLEHVAHVVAAIGTCTLDESIRKEHLVVLAICLIRRFELKKAIVVQIFVYVLGHAADIRELQDRLGVRKLTQCVLE